MAARGFQPQSIPSARLKFRGIPREERASYGGARGRRGFPPVINCPGPGPARARGRANPPPGIHRRWLALSHLQVAWRIPAQCSSSSSFGACSTSSVRLAARAWALLSRDSVTGFVHRPGAQECQDLVSRARQCGKDHSAARAEGRAALPAPSHAPSEYAAPAARSPRGSLS